MARFSVRVLHVDFIDSMYELHVLLTWLLLDHRPINACPVHKEQRGLPFNAYLRMIPFDHGIALFETPRDLRKGITNYVKFYNGERLHQSLNEVSPDSVYSHSLTRKTGSITDLLNIFLSRSKRTARDLSIHA